MKLLIFLTTCLALFACQKNSTTFETISCSSIDSTVNNNLHKVFKPCREYIYQAKYWDTEYNLISDELIWLMATGKGWGFQPELQDEIIFQFAYDPSRMDRIKDFNVNLSRSEIDWSKKEVTGVIETESEVWMHPFRENQYSFTEVSAFPHIKLPIYEGNSWTISLNLHEGWGDWENTTLNSTYTVLDYEPVITPFKKLDAWHVRAYTIAEFGDSQHDFWYNEEFGFVKMIIKNYKDQLLSVELKKVKE